MVCEIFFSVLYITHLATDIARDKRLSDLPAITTASFDNSLASAEKGGRGIHDCSPLDRHFLSYGERGSPPQVRLQEIGGGTPQYSTAKSIVSNVAVITTPSAEPTIAGEPPLPSTSSGPATTPDQGQEQEPAGRLAGGESHPPSAFDSTAHSHSRTRSRASQASGLLSIITLPSFIAHERSRPHSTSAGVQAESPVRPPPRRRYSAFGQRFSGSDSADEGAGGKRSPLHIFTSALKRSNSATSPVRSFSPPSRRSSRRSLGRLNLSSGNADEAAIEWKRLPPLPSGIHPTQPRRASAAEEPATERLPSYCESESGPPLFLPVHIPLPPSPSTLASSVSSLSYAPPSPEGIAPTNGFTTTYASYPPLPPSVPSTPGQFSYPPTPHSVNTSADSRMAHPTDHTVALAINTLNSLPGGADRTDPNLVSPMTATTLRARPGNYDGFMPPSPDGYDGPELPAYRRSVGSTHPQHSYIQEAVLPSPPLPAIPVTPPPPPPMSPRGPRPLPPTPGQLSRSGTLSSQMSSIGL
jgi:hypothetical protein